MHKFSLLALLNALTICAMMGGSASLAVAAQSADIVFVNGQIETLNSKQPQVQAVAVKDEKFLEVALRDLALIIGQKPKTTLAKKSIANFKR